MKKLGLAVAALGILAAGGAAAQYSAQKQKLEAKVRLLSSPVPGGLTCSWARIVYAKLSSEAIRKRLSEIVGKRNYRITRR